MSAVSAPDWTIESMESAAIGEPDLEQAFDATLAVDANVVGSGLSR